MASQLSTHELPAQGDPQAICIILHGVGDSHHGMIGLATALRMPDVHYALPDAPDPYMGIGYSWYPIPQEFFVPGSHKNRDELVAGCREKVLRCRQQVHDMIDALCKRFDNVPLILGGFSQGGLIAMDAGFTCGHALAGLFVLSSYFPQAREVLPLSRQRADLPVFIGHGQMDDVVDFAYCGEMREVLEAHGVNPQVHVYPALGHSVATRELEDLRAFVQVCLVGEDT
jgi:phospholipase/carboxylesterase